MKFLILPFLIAWLPAIHFPAYGQFNVSDLASSWKKREQIAFDKYGLDVAFNFLQNHVSLGDDLTFQLLLTETKDQIVYNPFYDFNYAVPIERISIYNQKNEMVSIMIPKVKSRHERPPGSLWHQRHGAIMGREFQFKIEQGKPKPFYYFDHRPLPVTLMPGKYFMEVTWNTLFLLPKRHYHGTDLHTEQPIPMCNILWAVDMEQSNLEVSRKQPFFILSSTPHRNSSPPKHPKELTVELKLKKETFVRANYNSFQVKWVNRKPVSLTLANPWLMTWSTMKPFRLYMYDSTKTKQVDSLKCEYIRDTEPKSPPKYTDLPTAKWWLTLPCNGIMITQVDIMGGQRSDYVRSKEDFLPLGKYSFQLVCDDSLVGSSEWGDYLRKLKDRKGFLDLKHEYTKRCKKEYEKFTGKELLRSNILKVEMIDPPPKEKTEKEKTTSPMKK